MRRFILMLAAGAVMSWGINDLANAGEMSQQSRSEVEALLRRLGASGCQFNRNGSWYSAEEAQAHLNKKLQYVIDKKLASSAEQFIEVAASKSSMSGQAYQVKCADGKPESSANWLNLALKDMRAKP